jgi:hypothetical protein
MKMAKQKKVTHNITRALSKLKRETSSLRWWIYCKILFSMKILFLLNFDFLIILLTSKSEIETRMRLIHKTTILCNKQL